VLFITFYTDDYITPYIHLKRSCDAVGVELYGERIDRGDRTWRQIVALKPIFIRKQLIKNVGKHDRVVWIDADSKIKKRPELLYDLKADIAARLWDPRRKAAAPGGSAALKVDLGKYEPMAGVIALKNTEPVRKCVGTWCKNIQSYSSSVSRPDQRSLKAALLEHEKTVDFQALPTEYCCFMKFLPPSQNAEGLRAVIQVSRWTIRNLGNVEKLAWTEKKQREDGTWRRDEWE